MQRDGQNQESKHDQNSGACCAHLRISWRTEPCDGYSIRGEVMPGAGTHGWWECDSNCGMKFTPRPHQTCGAKLETYCGFKPGQGEYELILVCLSPIFLSYRLR